MTFKTFGLVLLYCLISASAMASYDFNVEARNLSLTTQDGARLSGALFKYEINAEKISENCAESSGKTRKKCWHPLTLEASAVITDAGGTGNLLREHFSNTSSEVRSTQHPLVMNYWAVLTPFKDRNGKIHQCVTLDNDSLERAGMKVMDNRQISAPKEKVDKLLKFQVTSCQNRVAHAPALNEKYVLPY